MYNLANKIRGNVTLIFYIYFAPKSIQGYNNLYLPLSHNHIHVYIMIYKALCGRMYGHMEAHFALEFVFELRLHIRTHGSRPLCVCGSWKE